MNPAGRVALLVALAFLLSFASHISADSTGMYQLLSLLRLVDIPFKWFETFAHEASHGLAALLSGGSIEKMELQFVGSGTCWTRGGIAWMVSFAGYAGASLWGAMLYLSAEAARPKHAQVLAGVLLASIVLTALFWIRDLESLVIIAAMSAILVLALRFGRNKSIKYLVEFIGIYILIASIESPTFLFDGHHQGDGASLANQTGIPEFVWILLWEVIAIGLLFWLLRKTLRQRTRPAGWR